MKTITKILLALILVLTVTSCVTNHKVALSQNKAVL